MNRRHEELLSLSESDQGCVTKILLSLCITTALTLAIGQRPSFASDPPCLEKTLFDLDQMPEALQRLIQSVMRRRDDSRALKNPIFNEVISAFRRLGPKSRSQKIELIDEKNFSIVMNIRLSPPNLSIKIDAFRRGETKYGKRPENITMAFGRFVSAIMNGAIETVSKNPTIKEVRIRGLNVVNADLEQLLRKIGFEERYNAVPMFCLSAFGVLTAGLFAGALCAPDLTAQLTIGSVALMPAGAAAAVFKGFSEARALKNDFELVLKVMPRSIGQ